MDKFVSTKLDITCIQINNNNILNNDEITEYSLLESQSVKGISESNSGKGSEEQIIEITEPSNEYYEKNIVNAETQEDCWSKEIWSYNTIQEGENNI